MKKRNILNAQETLYDVSWAVSPLYLSCHLLSSLDCPRSSPGQVRGIFSGPGPGSFFFLTQFSLSTNYIVHN